MRHATDPRLKRYNNASYYYVGCTSNFGVIFEVRVRMAPIPVVDYGVWEKKTTLS